MAASKNFVPYVNITARYDGPPDQEVFEKYGLEGFPTFLFLDSEGVRLFDFRPETEAVTAEAIGDAKVLLAKAASGDSELGKARVTLIEGFRELREVSEAELASAAAVKGLEADFVRRYNAFVETKPFRDAIKAMQKGVQRAMDVGNREAAEAAQKELQSKLYAMCKEGKTYPEDGSFEYVMVWNSVFEGALEAKDKATAEKALAALEKAPQAAQFGEYLERQRGRLNEL